MITILTSSMGGFIKKDGERYPVLFPDTNRYGENIHKYWKDGAKVMIISAFPENVERNDSVRDLLAKVFVFNGLNVASVENCDCRNEQELTDITRYDVVILAGGHVPTQNAFFERLGLKQLLQSFDGLLIAWSAGSMNCAETVYAQPEVEGEGIDPDYQRFIPGLGVTKTMIIPHFQDVRKDIVDGLRVIEDMAYPDSMGREFLALNDGSYLVFADGVETLYGEAYEIKDGSMSQICRDGESIIYSPK